MKLKGLDYSQELGRPDVLCYTFCRVKVKLELGEEIARSYADMFLRMLMKGEHPR